LSAADRAKQLSPVEVTRASLERIDAWDQKINAMYVVDATGALAQASSSEARWRAGKPLSPLDGVPITVKDNIAVKGVSAADSLGRTRGRGLSAGAGFQASVRRRPSYSRGSILNGRRHRIPS
jgi:hypothetical protein